MLETAFAQLRFGASLIFGLPFAPWSLDGMVEAVRATQHEFGSLGRDSAEFLAGPLLDDDTRREVQLRRFRTQAQRGARETTYYRQLFDQLSIDPVRLRFDNIERIPPTSKAALRDNPDAFVRSRSQPCFRTTTTGTTGRPTSVCFSAHELQSFIALGAIDALVNQKITPEDVVLIAASARATLGNTCFAGVCARIGAQVMLGGLVAPEHTLALLAEPRHLVGKKGRVSQISIYPSYLGQLVTCGQQLGYRPHDFGLERIAVGGEVVTAGLKRRCQELFGPVVFDEGYGMTEPWPFGGTRCPEGHLHFEIAHGLLEVLRLDNDQPAVAGEAGRLVLTPFPPFRETTILLRYNTEDVVRVLAEPLTCALRHLPATSDLLGKQRLAVQHDTGWTFPRELAEALEAIDELPLPARYGYWAVPGGVAVNVLAPADTRTLRHTIAEQLEGQGVPLQQLILVTEPDQLRQPVPLRCDLREQQFDTRLLSREQDVPRYTNAT